MATIAGNRAAFANGGPVATLHPDFGRDPAMQLVVDGAVVLPSRDGTPLALNDPRLAGGWHAPEANLRRTTGNAALASSCTLDITVAGLESYWVRTASIVRRASA